MKLIWAVSQNGAARQQVSKLIKCALDFPKKKFSLTVVVSEFVMKIIVSNDIYILKVQRDLYHFKCKSIPENLLILSTSKIVCLFGVFWSN